MAARRTQAERIAALQAELEAVQAKAEAKAKVRIEALKAEVYDLSKSIITEDEKFKAKVDAITEVYKAKIAKLEDRQVKAYAELDELEPGWVDDLSEVKPDADAGFVELTLEEV